MIIFSDFDNTLCPHGNEAGFAKNLQAVQKFRRAGHQFCLATGRSLSSLQRAWKDYAEYLDALVLDNGAICLDMQEQTICEFAIPLEISQQMTQDVLAQFPDTILVIYNCDLSIGSDLTQPATKVRYWTFSNAMADEIAECITERQGNKVKAYPQYDCIPTPTISFIDPQCRAFVDVAAPEAGKENAAAKLGELLAPGQHIITVGDSMNDLDMLRRFDGYAIASGHPNILTAIPADHVVESVAELIGRLMQK